MKIRNPSGFTLIEMIIVIAVLGIVLAIAVPSFQEMISGYKIKSAASTLQSALLLTRSEAIKRNSNVTLSPVVAEQWGSGWNISLADGTVLSTYSPVAAVNITGGPVSIVYQGAGRVTGDTDATFKLASSNTTLIRCVAVRLSGLPTVASSGC